MSKWPKLSETAREEKHPDKCQVCALEGGDLQRWIEHDDHDVATPVVVVLCPQCADGLIESHPRLYSRIQPFEPRPGTNICCVKCEFRDGLTCKHKDLQANGGPGLKMMFEQPTLMHVDGRDKHGRRYGRSVSIYHKEPSCFGFSEVQP